MPVTPLRPIFTRLLSASAQSDSQSATRPGADRRHRNRPQRVLAAVVGAALLGSASLLFISTEAGASTPAYTAVENAYDSMHRTVTSGFGTAGLGGSYATSDPAGSFSVSGRVGKIASVAPGQSVRATLSGVVNADEQVQTRFSVPKLPASGGVDYFAVELRRQASGDGYRARVYFGSDGKLVLSVSQVRGGVEYGVGSDVATGQYVHASQQVTLQGAITGSSAVNLRVRAWLVGTPVPDWQLNYADSASTRLAAAGQVGIWCFTSNPARSGTISIFNLTGWALRQSSVAPSSSAAPTAGSSAPTSSAAPVTTTPSSAKPSSATPAPSTSSTSASPPAPTPTVGSVPVGSASYPVPAGAVFVSPAGSDAAGSGSITAPYASLSTALSKVAAGGTVVLRAGSYNEDVFSGTNNVTVQNYPGEAVWLDGSVPVSGWSSSAGVWVHSGWTARFDASQSFDSGSNAGGMVNPAYPMAAAPDQLFMDGTQLQQVAANPKAGQFAVNYSTSAITLGSDPGGHAMRASNLTQAFVVAGAHTTLRGFGVRDYATPLPLMGTLFFGGSVGGSTLQNLVIQDNASQGLSIDAPNETVDHVTVDRNGMTGIHANTAGGSVLQNSVIDANNTQHFNAAPSAAGIKISRLDGFTVRNNEVANNLDINGIWTDENVTHFTIVGNSVTGNGQQYGILNELSDTGVVADNTVSGSQYGYTAFDSGDIAVFNNDLSDSTVWGVGLTQDNRYQPGMGTAGASVQPSTANPWRVHNITIANNAFRSSGGMFQFYVLDKETNVPADSMSIVINGNMFTTQPTATMVGWGGAPTT